jgi:hypothetical protein
MLVKNIDFWDIFSAYPHQKEFMKAFFSGEYQYFCELVHRRGGKDHSMFHCAWLYANMVKGTFVYCLPKIGQARNVIFEGKDLDGVRWIDTIPQHLIERVNSTNCKIYFTNGSILHITGSDSLMNSHLGSNLKGIVFSEFQKSSPQVWDLVRPILKRSGGWAVFLYTAFGKGHAYRLFQSNKEKPDWSCRKLTVNDTSDNNGFPIFSAGDIQEELDSGMDPDLVQQEYYCNEEISIKGTFFAEQLDAARKEGRIVRGLKVNPLLPMHTSWDLGSRDTNSIWWFQVENGMFRYFYQHDHHYGDIDYYAQLLERIKIKLGFKVYSSHFMPHDVQQTEWAAGKTRNVQLIARGIRPTVVPRLKVIERVQCARHNFAKCVFDEVGCGTGLDALGVTRSKWNEKTQSFVGDEEHDWSSHPAAAFEYGHVGWMDSYNKPGLSKAKEYARLRK